MARRSVPQGADTCQSNRFRGPTGSGPLSTKSQPNSARGAALWLKRLWPLVALIAVMALVFAMGWHRYLSLEALAENRETLRGYIDAHMLVSLLAFVALYAAVVALSLPGGAVLTLAGGFLFGWLLGGARPSSAPPSARRSCFSSPEARSANSWRRAPVPGYPAFARAFRTTPSAICCSSGWCRSFRFGWSISPRRCSASASPPMSPATFLGIIPGTFAYSLAGSGLDSVIRAQQAAHQSCLAKMGPGGPRVLPVYARSRGAFDTGADCRAGGAGPGGAHSGGGQVVPAQARLRCVVKGD